MLTNKNILVGVTGSIAAYKSADLVRRLREAGATVRVAMTENAKRFITPLTMQAVSGFRVHDDLFDLHAEAAMGHIELARWADAVLVAPASADFMARISAGIADDLLTTICLTTSAKIVLAPAMNQGMWNHMSTQKNLQILQGKQIYVFEPGVGSQACGDNGPGRMLEPSELVLKLSRLFATGLLAGLKVLITAGPTHEPIDPVRFISNRSSGKMGYVLAEAAYDAGAKVTLISGPSHIQRPKGVTFLSVMSAADMLSTVMQHIDQCDIFIAAAAVGDYRVANIANEKLHKHEENFQLELKRNQDIVASIGKLQPRPFIVGFAAETENLIERARRKRQQKNMDIIIANLVGVQQGIGTDDNAVTVISSENEINLPLAAKPKLAREIVRIIAEKHEAFCLQA